MQRALAFLEGVPRRAVAVRYANPWQDLGAMGFYFSCVYFSRPRPPRPAVSAPPSWAAAAEGQGGAGGPRTRGGARALWPHGRGAAHGAARRGCRHREGLQGRA